jgi:hypothetical protein
MNVIAAATQMRKYMVYLPPEENNDNWVGRKHVTEMIEKIEKGEVAGEKAQRWLGWIQCAVYFYGGATSKELSEINQNA